MLEAIDLGQCEVAETYGTRGKVGSAYSILGRKRYGKRSPRRSRKRWVITKLVLRKTTRDICRSIVSSGGVFEHGDELPDFT
jgi:hypothetical protein